MNNLSASPAAAVRAARSLNDEQVRRAEARAERRARRAPRLTGRRAERPSARPATVTTSKRWTRKVGQFLRSGRATDNPTAPSR